MIDVDGDEDLIKSYGILFFRHRCALMLLVE